MKHIIDSLNSPERAMKFVGVGLAGLAVESVFLALFVEAFAWHALLAKVVAAELSILTMFHINDHWTFRRFRRAGFAPYARRLVSSHAVRLVGLAVGVGVFWLLHLQAELWYMLANVIAVGAGFAVNFAFETVMTWQAHHHDGDEEE